jgi:hypothetical protein
MTIRTKLLAAVLAAFVWSLSVDASAWGTKGHMMVAFIAYQQLTAATRARVDALIAMNPEFKTWKTLIPATVPKADRPAMLFMIAATWPDRIKRQATFHDDGTHNGNRPDGPPSSRNTGYADTLRHKYWHFVDQPFTVDGTALPALPTPNAQERIALFRSVLSSAAESDALKSYDLVWLLHLVGDVHQPLHDSTRVRKAQPDGDDGGNAVMVCAAHACNAGGAQEPLHSFWDGALGSTTVATAGKAAKLVAPADPGSAMILAESVWVTEGFALAQSSVYKTPIGKGLGPFSLTASYKAAARALAEKQIALAGARLGNVLNVELK